MNGLTECLWAALISLALFAAHARAEDSEHGRTMGGQSGLDTSAAAPVLPAGPAASFNYSGKKEGLSGAAGWGAGAPAPSTAMPSGVGAAAGPDSSLGTPIGSAGAGGGASGAPGSAPGGTPAAKANSSLNDGSVEVAKGVTKFERPQDLDIGVHEQLIDDRTGKKINANDIVSGRVPVGTVVDELTPSGKKIRATVEIADAQNLARNTGRNLKDPRFSYVDLTGASARALGEVFGLKAVNPNTRMSDHDIRDSDLPYYDADDAERDRIGRDRSQAIVRETVLKPSKNGDATIIGGK
jgi:hypothetical protein